MIQLLGNLICKMCDTRLDFVGHIGGDDFFVIFQSADWEVRCWELVEAFSAQVASLLSQDERAQSGYMAENRRGELMFQTLPSLSVGAVRIGPGECESHREVAAAASVAKKQAKKQAKEQPGKLPGSLFVERRRIGAGGELTSLAPQRCWN